MGKRAKRLKAPEAAKLLLTLVPTLKISSDESPTGDELHDDLFATQLLRQVIEEQDLGLLLTASPATRAAIRARIMAYAIGEGTNAKAIIGTVPSDAGDRAPLFLAMSAIAHRAGFDYEGRLREMRWKNESPASHRLLGRRRR